MKAIVVQPRTWDDEFEDAVDAFLAGCVPPRAYAYFAFAFRESYGSRWLRICAANAHKKETGVLAYLALSDGETKALGTIRRGDVMKSNGYRGPMKRVRGNIFDEWHGVRGSDGTMPIRYDEPF